ncbi:MAG TPA: hypothetical protein VIN40_08870 [Candidatus Tyrphobacter sp.]
MRSGRLIPSLLAAALLAGCAGGSHGSSALPSLPSQAAKRSGTATFVITVPKSSTQSATSALRQAQGATRQAVRPQYVSPATQSIAVDITGPTDVNETANLTVNSAGCTSTLASVVCTLTIPGLQPCTSPPTNCYTATLTTYDQTGGTGNVLSAAQAIAFTITAGATNTISLTLSGVPVTTLVTPADSNTAANGSGGYDVIGQGAHKFIAESLDADGNIIAGPGAPLFTIGTPSGSLSGVTTSPSTTTSSAPNNFTVTPPEAYAGGTASFTVTPTFTGQTTNGCTQTGANCTPATVVVDMKSVNVIIFLTSGTTWTVPSNWYSANNTIEVIGGGGGGGWGGCGGSCAGSGGGGGAGGGYSKVVNVTLTAGQTVTVAVGIGGGAGTSGGDTYLCNSTANCAAITGSAVVVGAKGGGGASTSAGCTNGADCVGGTGGSASSGFGTTTYSGGAGAGGSNGGGGGGGAAGPNGNGGSGGGTSSYSGGGGGGNGGGGNGGNGSGGVGGSGGTSATNGSGGAGGNGYPNYNGGGSGGNGNEFDASHGSGGGGGGDVSTCAGAGAGGEYGGGGGGAGYECNDAGSGGGGLIVITYTSP